MLLRVKTALFILMLLPLLGGCCTAPRSKPAGKGETVLLLPGLARTPRSMSRMQRALEAEGYAVQTLKYPSTRQPVEVLARDYLAPAVTAAQENAPAQIHFIGHSLGGIIIRDYLASHELPQLGRIVMLGTPNQGSEVVDKLGHMKLFGWINGPAGLQLGTAPDSAPQTLPTPAAEIGVIAGTRSINWVLSSFIPGTDDGKVSTERAQLEGMSDFKTVPKSHPFLMRDPAIIEMCIHFLANGRFISDGK